MVGGGEGAFIGAVHRMAAALDGQATLVAGCFGSTPERSRSSGRAIGVGDDRVYGSWQEMIDAESARPADQRLDFISIVTPNDTHAPIAAAAIKAGFNVVIDKPVTRTASEADQLLDAAVGAGVIAAVTYNYTGYPMVRQAAAMCRAGALGAIRRIAVEYHQGWLATDLAAAGQKQASWRADPARAGAGALGDIGTHAENLAAFVTGLKTESVFAEVNTLVPGRRVDDDAAVLIRYEGGARGTLSVSQVAVGEENNLSLRIYGSEASLAWRQESPNELVVMPREGPRQVLSRGGVGAGPDAAAMTRIPAGHPEGFIEAFANIYRGVFELIRARRESREPEAWARATPGIAEGARGLRFIEAAQRSAREGKWISVH